MKRKGGPASAILWKLSKWTNVDAAIEFTADLSVNEANYGRHIYRFDLLADQSPGRVINAV